jgi:hypothetical protein
VSSHAVTEAGFAVVAAGLLALEVVARRAPGVVPTLSEVLCWAMRRRSTQLGLLLAWWWLGWHFILGL